MVKECEQNRVYAEKLAALMANHPNMRVIVWIDTYGINDDYYGVVGNMHEPCIETLVIGKYGEYYKKEDNPYDDCVNYYGLKEVYGRFDEEIEEMAKQIPWEDVIAVKVGVN